VNDAGTSHRAPTLLAPRRNLVSVSEIFIRLRAIIVVRASGGGRHGIFPRDGRSLDLEFTAVTGFAGSWPTDDRGGCSSVARGARLGIQSEQCGCRRGRQHRRCDPDRDRADSRRPERGQRVLVSPSPKTGMGSPEMAWRTKRGNTIPCSPLWRGPTALNNRAMTKCLVRESSRGQGSRRLFSRCCRPKRGAKTEPRVRSSSSPTALATPFP
jgi:hypothetical protein